MGLLIVSQDRLILIEITRMIELIKRISPDRSQLIPVFAWISFLLFSWTLYGFLYRLSSWLLYLSFVDILSILSYSVVFAFFESVIVLLFLILLSLVLPAHWYRWRFQAQSFVNIFILFFVVRISIKSTNQILLNLLMLIAFPIINILIIRLEKLNKVIERIEDRFVVFLYVYIPLSGIGLVVVLLRNILN
jgi:hypothetical protein